MLFRRMPSHRSLLEGDCSSSKSSIVSGWGAQGKTPYTYLINLQLDRCQPSLKGDFGMNSNCKFNYHGFPISFDVSSDCHTFMVSSQAYKVSEQDDEALMEEKYLDLSRDLVGICMEWNDEGEITLYQNLPIGLVQEDCLGEFQTILRRFLKELVVVNTSLIMLGSPRPHIVRKAHSQKSMSLRNIFGGRSV